MADHLRTALLTTAQKSRPLGWDNPTQLLSPPLTLG